MKKVFVVLLSAITLFILPLHLNAGNIERYSDLCITNEEYQTLIKDKTLSEEFLFQQIFFDEYALVYDRTANRLFYSLIENSSSAYNPMIDLDSSIAGTKLAIIGSEITDDIISAGTEFQMVIYTDTHYQLANLAFTTLPLISIEYEGELIAYQGNVAEMKFRLFDNRADATQRITTSIGDIHLRGGVTQGYPKAGYKFTLYDDSIDENRRESNNSLLGMRKDGDWILYPAYLDYERVRNVFSTNLWNESCGFNNICGIQNGMEYKYVELILNAQYWGIYAIAYPIDAQQLQLSNGEYMYEKSDYTVSELDIPLWGVDTVAGYTIKDMGVNTEESWDTLRNYYIAMLHTNDQYTSLQKMVDIGNCIDIYLFYNMIQGVDNANLHENNILYNTYLTSKYINNGASQIILYTPWDMDRTWGNGFGNESYNVTADTNTIMQSNLVNLLLSQNDKDMKEMVVARYDELRESYWSDEHLLTLIGQYECDIFHSGSFQRDTIRWPDGYHIEGLSNLDLFKNYVTQRMSYMDAYIAQYR